VGLRTKLRIAPLNAARTAQRAVPTNPNFFRLTATGECWYKEPGWGTLTDQDADGPETKGTAGPEDFSVVQIHLMP